MDLTASTALLLDVHCVLQDFMSIMDNVMLHVRMELLLKMAIVILTLVFTPSMLAVRVWATTYAIAFFRMLGRFTLGKTSRAGEEWVLRRAAKRAGPPVLLWSETEEETIEREGGLLVSSEPAPESEVRPQAEPTPMMESDVEDADTSAPASIGGGITGTA